MDDVISLAVGEPGFQAADHIIEAAERTLRNTPMHYTDVPGILPLREAIAAYTLMHKGLSYDPGTQTQVTHGATTALSLAFTTLVEPGDEVILGSPYFSTYENMVITAGGVPVPVPLRAADGFHHRAEQIEAALSERTRVIVLNSPGNPTGAVTTLREWEQIADLARQHDLWVISDEVYHRFLYDDAAFFSIAALPEMQERTLLIDSFSKTYAMTGWRLGYMHGPSEVIAHTSALAEAVTSSNNAASQAAGLAALTGPQDALEHMLAQYTHNRAIVQAAVQDSGSLLSLPSVEGAFYAFIDIRKTGVTSHDFALGLLHTRHVAVVPGDAFGPQGQGWIRVSYVGNQDELAEGMHRLADYARECAALG